MEYRNALTSKITMINSSNNNNLHPHNRRKKRITTKRQELPSPSLALKNQYVPSLLITDSRLAEPRINQCEQQIPMKTSFSWTKKWTKWFSSCGSERTTPIDLNSKSKLNEKRSRTKSENDVSKRASLDHDEKKRLSTTNSSFVIGENSKENQEGSISRTTSQKHQHLHQSNDRVNNSNIVLRRDNSRRYSNSFFTSARYSGIHTSVSAIPTGTTTTATASTLNTSQAKQPTNLSRSVDRLHSKAHRRELRYEEHDDYIPPPPLHSIQCHPTIDHYRRSLNQSTYFSSTHRRSQIDTYKLSSINNRLVLPRPYSTNIPISQSIQIMSKTSLDNTNSNNNNSAYEKLSECHSRLIPLENSSVKAPRRIESAYSQFPIQTEPIYANTQSLYDNIVFPQSVSKISNINLEQEKKSCASQTQLTWTMATFSSFVDLENQSIVIPQPDPNTIYSIVKHQNAYISPSASPETIQHMRRISPGLQHLDDTNAASYYQRPLNPAPTNIRVEKRDGSFQTLLTIGPSEDIESSKKLLIHDASSSPNSTGSLGGTNGQLHQHQHHHHHHHRRHKSRNNSSPNHISTRDVGLQVNIQTVKKITFSSQKTDDSSLATTTSTPKTTKTSPVLKHVETNTEPLITKRDKSTFYESNIRLVTSSSQTFDSPAVSTTNCQTKAAQTVNKTLRDQSIETNNRGLFVCDLSSLLSNGLDESSSSSNSASLNTKQKS
ncbi:unnamed protein product [Rotaria socialis]|uniref:Uncharacterized protein n=5 Tax=Rotaria socialis TaxID=392032 RepID=A0A820J3F5_9BILA|nr:unnamed protein product [Rotaria socialis]CAF4317657.1 unnamed protein product [Rotaria socialis]